VVLPPLLDIQVNGFSGVDFSDAGLTTEMVARAAGALRAAGVARFMPTLITAPLDDLEATVARLVAAIDADADVRRAVVGLHLEGPFISAAAGPRGAHLPEHMLEPSELTFARIQEVAEGQVRMITIAPELPGAVAFIRRRVAEGVVVAIGHTDAGREDIQRAVDAGATLSTHLGNGTHELLPRHDNYVWHQLGEDRLSASFIADGHHLPPHVLRSMVRAKGVARSVLVTDATAAAGGPPGRYTLGGMEVRLLDEGDAARLPDGRMAGSSLRLDAAINNVMAWCDVTLADAVDMASRNPASLLGLDLGLGPTSEDCAVGVHRDGSFAVLGVVREPRLARPEPSTTLVS